MDYRFRAASAQDEPFLWRMLVLAAHESTLEAVEEQPCLARYVAGWGRAGDSGRVATLDGQPVGAAWLRLWPDTDRGFAYIDDATPELSIAVLPEHRGRGVATRLLAQVLESARGVHAALSLSVRADNPALRLYQRAGFVAVEDSAITNRSGGESLTMIRRLDR